jgi:hypothetical protein
LTDLTSHIFINILASNLADLIQKNALSSPIVFKTVMRAASPESQVVKTLYNHVIDKQWQSIWSVFIFCEPCMAWNDQLKPVCGIRSVFTIRYLTNEYYVPAALNCIQDALITYSENYKI